MAFSRRSVVTIMNRFFIFSSLVWLVFSGFVTAQDKEAKPDPDKKKDPSGRRAWVISATVSKDLPNPLPMMVGTPGKEGAKIHKVSLRTRSIDRAIPVDASGLVRAVEPIKGEDGKVTYKMLSRSVVPEGVKDALIVLVPKKNYKNEWIFDSKVIDLSKFRKGGCLYVNLVNTRIGVGIGAKDSELRTVIESNDMRYINPIKKDEDNKVLPIRFLYEIPDNDRQKWKLMTSSKMYFVKSRREICIFYYDEKIKNVNFRGLAFMVPEKKEK